MNASKYALIWASLGNLGAKRQGMQAPRLVWSREGAKLLQLCDCTTIQRYNNTRIRQHDTGIVRTYIRGIRTLRRSVLQSRPPIIKPFPAPFHLYFHTFFSQVCFYFRFYFGNDAALLCPCGGFDNLPNSLHINWSCTDAMECISFYFCNSLASDL